MKFSAKINIMPLTNLLDPQGKAVANNLKMQGYNMVHDVRIGKHIVIEIEAPNEIEASQQVNHLCKFMLVNAVMENYTFEINTIN